MCRCRNAPDDDGRAQAHSCADADDHAAGDGEPDGIGQLEGHHDVAVVDLAPARLLLQCRLQDADDLSIDVVDRRGEKQQPTDPPAIAADATADRDVADHGLTGTSST
jgi:hypothetical protein